MKKKTDINAKLEDYSISISLEYAEDEVQTILKLDKAKLSGTAVLETLFSCIDLTSLNTSDSVGGIKRFVEKVNEFPTHYPSLKHVGAVCIYPSFVETVRNTLKVEGVQIAAVAGVFPSSQSFLEVKVRECELAVEKGADEVDVVISVGSLLEGDYVTVYEEIKAMKEAVGKAHLKVILETGELKNMTNIRIASIIAMEAGADFIKTSTGKVGVNATREAAYVMCRTIKHFYEKTGKKVGFKPAGGIVTLEDALDYATIVHHELGEEWLTPHLFRFGASRLANNILSALVKDKGLDAPASFF